MKTIHKITLIIAAITMLMLAFPQAAHAAPITDDRTVIGESYTLESGRILDGNLNVIGGVVEIEETASVNGNVFVLGGLVTIEGTIKGDLTAVGGTVNLKDTAILEGDLISPVSYINIDPGARILGDQVEKGSVPGFNVEQFTNIRPQTFRPRTTVVISFLTRIGKFLALALAIIALGALLLLIMPKPTERMTKALVDKPWHMLGYGALTTVVMLSVAILTVTICLIPFVVLVGLVFAMAILVGWLALGYQLGKRIASGIFNTTWHPVLTAVLGNLALYLIAYVVNLIPCIGWLPVFIAMLFSIGMAITTLFGTYPYPRTLCQEEEAKPVVLFEEGKPAPGMPPTTEETVDIEVTPEVPVVEEEIIPEVPIEVLNLGTRINNILIDAGLVTVNDVLARLEESEASMLEISGFGEKSLDELKQALYTSGYKIP